MIWICEDWLDFFNGVESDKRKTGNQSEEEFERCVACNEQIGTKKATPIALRKNFIQGVGELCDVCRHKRKQ